MRNFKIQKVLCKSIRSILKPYEVILLEKRFPTLIHEEILCVTESVATKETECLSKCDLPHKKLTPVTSQRNPIKL